jgi:hypothetical protein
VQVLAGGEAEDLSPTAEQAPASFPDGRLHVAFQDANPSGEQFGWLVSHSVFSRLRPRRFQIRDVGCQGKCVRQINLPLDGPIVPSPEPPMLALVGFKLYFTGARDHELDRIGVWFQGSDLHVAFRDANGDDVFGYLVDFIAIPGDLAGFNVWTRHRTRDGKGTHHCSARAQSRADFLLTGWAFNFRGAVDHEILDLGVVRHGTSLSVMYADNGGGTEFDWRVHWAQIAPQVFTES